MIRRVVLAAALGLLAACIALPVEAAEWCINDPPVKIQAPNVSSSTVYVTEAALGVQHEASLNSARISYTTGPGRQVQTVLVCISDYVPADQLGPFPTKMTVSSAPDGGGTVYGSTNGAGGSAMTVCFDVATKWGSSQSAP